MTAHVKGGGGQVTILMSTEGGINWTHEGTAIPTGGSGHTGYARGYIHDGQITYVSLNRGGGNPTWRISQDRDGGGVDAKMVGDPFPYVNKTKGRGTEAPPHQIIRRENQFWGFFLRKQIGSHGSGIGNATLPPVPFHFTGGYYLSPAAAVSRSCNRLKEGMNAKAIIGRSLRDF